MRIGLSGGASSAGKMVEQAQQAEADGFTSLWYAGAVGGDPLVTIALAGRATSSIELGTSVLPSYPTHPVLQANRAASVVDGMGRAGFTLGIGPSHQPVIEGMLGLSYDRPGRHTEEYVRILTSLLRGETVHFDGDDFRVNATGRPLGDRPPVPVLVAALGPRLLRVAGELTEGTILWMGNERAIETHIAPRLTAAAEGAGRPAPRVVAGLPVVVHDDVSEARATAAEVFALYGALPNYRRVLDIGGAIGPQDAAIVGDEVAVTARILALFAAGATDVWAAVFPVGADPDASRRRTRALLKELAAR